MIILKVTWTSLSGGQILRRSILVFSITILLLSGCDPPVLGLISDDLKETEIEVQYITEKTIPDTTLSEKQEEIERKLFKRQMESPDIQPPKRFRSINDDKKKEKKQLEKTELDTKLQPSQERNKTQSKTEESYFTEYQKIIEKQQKIIEQLLNKEIKQQKEEKTKRTEPKLKVDRTENEQRTEATLYINYTLPNNAILLIENNIISLYRSNQLQDSIYYAIEKTEKNLSDKEIEQLFDIVVEIEELLQGKDTKKQS